MSTKARYPGIFKRETKRNGTVYDAQFRDDDGRQRWRTFDTLAEARAFKQDSERDVRRDEYVDTSDRATVAEYARQYLMSRAHEQRQTTRDRQSSAVRTHVEGTTLGGMPLVKVRREHVDAWLAERSAVLARSTLRTHASLLRSVLAYAVDNRRIKTAPVVRMPKATARDAEVYAPTLDEVRALAGAMPDATTRAMVLVQAGTGARISELFALRRCDVSTTFRTVKITGQLSRKRERVDLKTDTSARTVPMSEHVAAALDGLDDAGPDDGYLFTSSTGRPFCMQSYGATFKRAAKTAGLPESVTTHDLRHHFATTLLRAGLSPVAVGHLLGHTDGTLVLRLYGHWMPDDDDLARRALDAAWGGDTSTLRAVR